MFPPPLASHRTSDSYDLDNTALTLLSTGPHGTKQGRQQSLRRYHSLSHPPHLSMPLDRNDRSHTGYTGYTGQASIHQHQPLDPLESRPRPPTRNVDGVKLDTIRNRAVPSGPSSPREETQVDSGGGFPKGTRGWDGMDLLNRVFYPFTDITDLIDGSQDQFQEAESDDILFQQSTPGLEARGERDIKVDTSPIIPCIPLGPEEIHTTTQSEAYCLSTPPPPTWSSPSLNDSPRSPLLATPVSTPRPVFSSKGYPEAGGGQKGRVRLSRRSSLLRDWRYPPNLPPTLPPLSPLPSPSPDSPRDTPSPADTFGPDRISPAFESNPKHERPNETIESVQTGFREGTDLPIRPIPDRPSDAGHSGQTGSLRQPSMSLGESSIPQSNAREWNNTNRGEFQHRHMSRHPSHTTLLTTCFISTR